ncbi:MAG: hypothetical protein ABIK68_23505 [bacterium]
MKHTRTLLCLLALIVLLSFSGCATTDEDTTSAGSSATVFEDVETVVGLVFESVSEIFDGGSNLPDCLTYIVSADQSALTVTYNRCTDSATGVTINGTLAFASISSGSNPAMRSISGSDLTMIMTGTVNITGSSVSTISFNLTIVLPFDSSRGELSGSPTSIKGTITADGIEYNASSFNFTDGVIGRVTNPHFVIASMKSDRGSLIVYSENGSAWGYPNLAQVSSPIEDLRGIACNSAGKCVAVGDNGAVFYTADGVTWTAGNSGTTSRLRGVAFGNNRWVAVGDGGIIYSDTDGASWSASGVTSGLQDVAYGDGSGTTRWVAVSQSASSYKSTDGATWTALNMNSVLGNTEGWMQSICFGNNVWVSVGLKGMVYYATDPSIDTNWTSINYGGSKALTGVSYGNGRFIAVGEGTNGWNGQSPILIVSDNNGVSWGAKDLPAEFTSVSRPLGDIAYGDGRWSAMGNGGDHLLSTDGGETWTVIALDQYGAYAIAYRP